MKRSSAFGTVRALVVGALATVLGTSLVGCSKDPNGTATMESSSTPPPSPKGGSSPDPTSPVGSEEVRPRALADVPGHENLGVDRNAKEDPRLLPQEALIRSYLRLFGGLAPIASQMALRQGSTTLFDRWLDYLGALGIPNHRIDQPRGVETSTLMLATFERIGIALCDKSLQHDLRRTPALPINERYIFAFDAPPGPLTEAAFNDPFDTLHRTFLGYPASLADAQRTLRYLALYNQVYAAHSSEDAGVTGFTPSQAGWAAVCYGLLRHPEFQTY